MPFFSQIAFNTLASYLGRIISSIFALAVTALMTRALGPEKFGEYATIIAYLSMFVILADMGLQTLMTREISKNDGEVADIAGSFFTLRLIGSLVFLAAGLAAALLFPYSYSIRVGMVIAAAGFLFLSASQLLLSIFQKHLAMHLTAVAEIAGRGVQFLLVYAIYLGFLGSLGGGSELFLFLGAMSAASLIIFILQYIFASRYITLRLTFNVKQWLDIVKTAWPIALSIVLTLIYFKIDTIFLSIMKPQADVGIYGVAYRVLESLIFFPAMFSGIVMPMLSREALSRDLTRFRKIFSQALRTITVFAMPAMAGGIVLSYSIASLIGGKDFVIAGAPLQALFVATCLIFFGNLLGRAVIALDLQKKAVFAYLFGVILNVILNFIFIPKYTYMGAAWTTVATELLITVFLFWLVWGRAFRGIRDVRVFKEVREIRETAARSFLAAGVMAGVLWYLASPVSEPLSFAKLGVFTVLGGAIYFGLLYLLSGLKHL